MTEADTCRELVSPKLLDVGWGSAPHVIGEQRTSTNGRIIVTGGRVRRGRQRRSPYAAQRNTGSPAATRIPRSPFAHVSPLLHQLREHVPDVAQVFQDQHFQAGDGFARGVLRLTALLGMKLLRTLGAGLSYLANRSRS